MLARLHFSLNFESTDVWHCITFMKPTKTKRELRDELENQLKEFLHQGGAVKTVPQGVSGRENTGEPLKSIFSGQTSEDRTLVPEVVAAIEARRKPALTSNRAPKRKSSSMILVSPCAGNGWKNNFRQLGHPVG
jgi:hypothetical protein